MKISTEKAKPNKLFYVVATGVIYHPKRKKCLILQRSHKEITHPGLWGVPGGKLEWKDLQETPKSRQNFDVPDWVGLVEKILYREIVEECNLEVSDPRYLGSVVFIRPDNVPAALFMFAVKYKSGRVKISEDFEDYAWVDEKEVKKYKHIMDIDWEVEQAMKLYL